MISNEFGRCTPMPPIPEICDRRSPCNCGAERCMRPAGHSGDCCGAETAVPR